MLRVLNHVIHMQYSAADIEESRSRGALLFATLKKLNRTSHLYCKEARDKTLEVNMSMHAINLICVVLLEQARVGCFASSTAEPQVRDGTFEQRDQ